MTIVLISCFRFSLVYTSAYMPSIQFDTRKWIHIQIQIQIQSCKIIWNKNCLHFFVRLFFLKYFYFAIIFISKKNRNVWWLWNMQMWKIYEMNINTLARTRTSLKWKKCLSMNKMLKIRTHSHKRAKYGFFARAVNLRAQERSKWSEITKFNYVYIRSGSDFGTHFAI